MRKRFFSMVLALLLLFTACSGGQEVVDVEADESVEGEIMIYTSIYEDIIDQILPVLKAKFPNADIEFFQGGTGAIQSKIASEMDSGKLDCDMMLIAEPSYALELKEEGYLHAYDAVNKVNILDELEYDEEGYWYPVRISNMVLAYNPENVEKEEVAQTLEEFSKLENISMSNPLTSGTALASISGLYDAYGQDYFKELGQANVAVESGSVALGKLETGECSEIMVLEESVLKKREEESSPLEVIYPEDGTLVIPSPIMIVDGEKSKNNNTEACEKVLDWFLTEEGQEVIVKGWMHSVIKDMDAPFDGDDTLTILNNQLPINWESTYKNREDLRTMFENYVSVPES